MNDRLEMQQSLGQTQTLAPLQVQYVKLLEMNTAAIEDEVQRRLDENPALEAKDSMAPHEQEEDGGGFSETAEDLQRADYRSEDDMPPVPHQGVHRVDADARRRALENDPDEQDMAESLQRQVGELPGLDAQTAAFARYIIGSLDSNGRMTRPLAALADDIAVSTGLDVTADDLRPALDAVRSLDPAGVCAADLRDCLLLQLDRREPSKDVELAREIVDRHFDLLGMRRRDKLMAKTGTSGDPEALDRALRIIQTLNPKPGNSEAGQAMADRAMHITPDFTVEPDPSDPSGERQVVALTQRIPELGVADWKIADIGAGKGSAGAKAAAAQQFMRSRMQEAQDFIGIMHRRTDTLLAIMQAIVRVQAEFFRTADPSTIRPMILKDIAEAVGRDISVVSRATAGKYVATPSGTYPLKMFFNERPSDESDASAHQVIEAIRAIIAAEDRRHPLADDAIADKLQERGMPIARRTVTKYREQLSIPNSRGRRSLTSDNK